MTTVDPKVYDLAEEFILDSGVAATMTNVRELSEVMQQAIEDWLEEGEK